MDERDSQLITVHDPRGRTYTQRRHNQTTGRKAAIAVLMLAGRVPPPAARCSNATSTSPTAASTSDRDKTEAGMREIDTLPLLREILVEHRAQKLREAVPTRPDDPVLITATGRARDRYNLADVVAAVVRRADELQAQRGGKPLPLGITPHKLRHTFASILVALGKDPNYRDGTARAHLPRVHAARLQPHHAPQRRGASGAGRALVDGEPWPQRTDEEDSWPADSPGVKRGLRRDS